MKKNILFLILSIFLLTGCQKQRVDQKQEFVNINKKETIVTQPTNQPKEKKNELVKAEKLIIKIDSGEIEIKLFPDKAPNTVSNFAKKARSDFYKGLTFHRVEDWVVQGGDPLGNGTGGGDMLTELNDIKFEKGSVGVARGQNIKISNDAQFFICTKDSFSLDGQYTNFGKVVKGMDLVDKIKIGDKILDIIAE